MWRHFPSPAALYFVSADHKLMAVQIRGGPNLDRGTAKPLFGVRLPPNGWYDVGKDGRFLIPSDIEQSATVPLAVVVNWRALLKK